MRRILSILVCMVVLSACAASLPEEVERQEGEIQDSPQMLADIGKSLTTLKRELPEAAVFTQPDAYPDAAAVCFGKLGAQSAYVFWGTQGEGDIHALMDAHADELNCCGILSEVGILFPDTSDVTAFSDFFTSIGVSEYSYFSGEDDMITQGWLTFTYDAKTVWINTNELCDEGGWTFTGREEFRSSAPIVITDETILHANLTLAEQWESIQENSE